MAPVIDLVFSGGGTRGVALAGAIEVLEQKRPVIKRLLGTSAGAIAAVFGAAGFTGREYLKLVPEKEGDRFLFNAFFAPPPGEIVRAAAIKKDSQSRLLLHNAVDGALDGLLKNIAQRRPRIGGAIQGAVALGKDTLVEAAFTGFIERANQVNPPGATRLRSTIFALIEFGGLFDPNLFRDWLPRVLARRVPLIDERMTLKQFHDFNRNLGRELSVVVADTNDHQPLVLNHRTAPDCPVVEAVLMSLSVPMVWPDVVWKKEWGTYLGRDITGHLMVDGGLKANFPIHFLMRRDEPEMRAIFGDPEPAAERPAIIGLLLDESRPVPGDVAADNEPEILLLERMNRMLASMQSYQQEHVKEAEDLICHIGVKGHPPLELKQDPATILRLQALVNSGRCAMGEHLKKRRLF